MPPKKGIAFGKIGSFGQLTLNPSPKDAKDESVGGFGKFTTKNKDEDDFMPEPTEAVQQAMGFQGFGKSKAAKGFDIESLVEQNKQSARERALLKKPEEPEPTTSNQKEQEEESDEDVVGPMPAPPAPEPEAFKAPRYDFRISLSFFWV